RSCPSSYAASVGLLAAPRRVRGRSSQVKAPGGVGDAIASTLDLRPAVAPCGRLLRAGPGARPIGARRRQEAVARNRADPGRPPRTLTATRAHPYRDSRAPTPRLARTTPRLADTRSATRRGGV